MLSTKKIIENTAHFAPSLNETLVRIIRERLPKIRTSWRRACSELDGEVFPTILNSREIDCCIQELVNALSGKPRNETELLNCFDGRGDAARIVVELRCLRDVVLSELRSDVFLTSFELESIYSWCESLQNGALQKAEKTDMPHPYSRFLSVLAHDLRCPLSCARMSAQMMLRFPNGGAQMHKKLTERIIATIDRMDQMIADLLDAQRGGSPEGDSLAFEECDLVSLASSVISDFVLIHGDRFELKATGPVRGVWSASSLVRVLENLLTNAIKYGSASSPVILNVEMENGFATFSVKNFGNPIPDSEQARLFLPFQRGSSAHERRQQGWGIGLSLVKGIVERHGGTVRLESGETLGTIFTVTLPLDARRRDGAGLKTAYALHETQKTHAVLTEG